MYLSLFALSFFVQPLSNTTALDVVLAQRSPIIVKYARPSTINLSRGGRVAAVAAASAESVQSVLVLNKDGHRDMWSIPDSHALAKVFFANTPGFPGLTITEVATPDDAGVYATLSMPFAGAYGGTEEAVFAGKDRRWVTLSSTQNGGENAAIVAVDADGSRLWAEDSLNATPADFARLPRHAEFEGRVSLQHGSKRIVIGTGIPEALRDNIACGTHIEENGRFTAVTWGRHALVRLGAGIAWDLSGPDYVVGDDRGDAESFGHPMLWRHGMAIRLSDHVGAAFGTSHDGMIVGSIDDDAFYVAPGDAQRRLVIIDRVLRSAGWHVSSAFGVSDDHKIVAFASRGKTAPQVVVLTPSNLQSK